MFGYFGSKYRDAGLYQPPMFDVIVEPFAGAAAYAMHWLTLRTSARCVLIEKDPAIAALWRRLLAMEPADVLALPDVNAGDRCREPLVALCKAHPSKHAAEVFTVTDWIAPVWPHHRRRIASTLARVKGRVEIIEGDYTDAPTIEASWFIDPPYQHQGHVYRHGSKGIDYQALAEWCRTRPGHVQVCESAPADWMDFRHHHSHRTQSNVITSELVWESHPPLTLFDERREQ